MKISETWLKQYFPNLNLSAEEIGHQLTMAGLELDDLYKVAPDFSGVVIGEVLSCNQHPDADKLKVTTVNIGTETLQIVCGAPNVRVGLKVAVATVGAILPPIDGKPFTIKKGKLRGIESFGMLCGASELGLPDEIDGLLELDDDAPIGINLREYLALDGHILDISITPNRGDCFSVLGIAREIAVIHRLKKENNIGIDTHQQENKKVYSALLQQNVVVQADDACPRYLLQPIFNIDRSKVTPKWLKDRLIASGLRTHNFLVDVTNYVLLELGQPLHAFDADKVVGDVCVRLAHAGETFTLLNEQTVTLTGDELVIADSEGVLALAGIMGGLRSAVTDSTTNIILESAFFAPNAIAGRARRFGLHTDASQRFERGVDFNLPKRALNRAVDLITSVAGGEVGRWFTVENLDNLPKRLPIQVALTQVKSLLGVDIAKDEIIQILTHLEIIVEDKGAFLVCTPPSHRFDLTISEDIVEEIARIYGYDNIAPVLPSLLVDMDYDDGQDLLLNLKNTLVSEGYQEAISFSFSDEKLENLLHDEKLGAILPLANPISSDLAVMRRTLLSSLLPIVQYNLNRKQNRLRFFETGLSFVGKNVSELVQTPSLAMISVGDVMDKSIYTNRPFDFFDFKGDIENLLPANLDNRRVGYQRADLAFLHKGQSAYLLIDDKKVGWFGQLHPSIAQALDLPTTWVAEFAYETILNLYHNLPKITPPSKFPQVRRDLAFLIDTAVDWQTLAGDIRIAAGEFLIDLALFDVYEGEHLPAGKKSVAFTMAFENANNTLDDETIKTLMDKVIDILTQNHNAKLRDS